MTRWRVEDPHRQTWPGEVTVVRDTGMNVSRRRYVDAREASAVVGGMLDLLAEASAAGLVPASEIACLEEGALGLGLRAGNRKGQL